MEHTNKFAIQKMEDFIKRLYEKLKCECKTYGELQERITKEAGIDTWDNLEVGMCLQKMLMKFLNDEIYSLQINR